MKPKSTHDNMSRISTKLSQDTQQLTVGCMQLVS